MSTFTCRTLRSKCTATTYRCKRSISEGTSLTGSRSSASNGVFSSDGPSTRGVDEAHLAQRWRAA